MYLLKFLEATVTKMQLSILKDFQKETIVHKVFSLQEQINENFSKQEHSTEYMWPNKQVSTLKV